MAANSAIGWTTHTFNPWLGCSKVSRGCENCYAEAWSTRFGRAKWGPNPRERTSAQNWNLPLRWNREAERDGTRPRVFCASLADVLDTAAPNEWRTDLWRLIEQTPHLDWLLLTKRINDAAQRFPLEWFRGKWPSNVWVGTTVCDQAEADANIPFLLDLPAPVRFLSCEPLLGPLDIQRWLETCHADRDGECSAVSCPQVRDREPESTGRHCPLDDWGSVDEWKEPDRLSWVIVGGESGHRARPMHERWVRALRDQCVLAEVPFFFKQWGEWLSCDYSPDDDPWPCHGMPPLPAMEAQQAGSPR